MFGVVKKTDISKEANKNATNDQRAIVDIEDIGSGGPGAGSKRPVVHRIQRTATTASESAPKKEETTERVPLNTEDFSKWLSQKKSLWRTARGERKRLLAKGDDDDRRGSRIRTKKNPSSLEGFVKEAALNLTQREWHVVEVREMSSFEAGGAKTRTSSGEFILWVMVGSDSLQKIQLTVPRTVYVSSRMELTNESSNIIGFKKVDKHLPHCKTAGFLYEVTMPEHVYKTENWASGLKARGRESDGDPILEGIYETGVPLMVRALTDLGCISRLNSSRTHKAKGQKSHFLSELKRVDRPTEGHYLNNQVSYKRCFLYVRLHPRAKTGLVAVFTIHGGSGSLANKSENEENQSNDVTDPAQSGPGAFDVSASCQLWVVKPGSSRGQKSISVKNCDAVFSDLLSAIQQTADIDSDYACLSPGSSCKFSTLTFVDNEKNAFSAANEALTSYSKSNNGPTFLVLDSNKPMFQLRRHMFSLNSVPVIPVPCPPGPDHHPSMSTLPALQWEQRAVQLCLEAYLYMNVVSFPKRVSYARYGNLPVGNLGDDENFALYDLGLSRMLQKNRSLSWGSAVSGQPDLGTNLLPSANGSVVTNMMGVTSINQDELWGDDDQLISPVIRRPGCYRSVCVDIDLQDLAIAALTDTANLPSFTMAAGATSVEADNRNANNPNSPTSVAFFHEGNGLQQSMMKSSEPLGDEMATSTALPMLRALIGAWLRDAFTSNNSVADSLLHHVYRVISHPDTLMHDPALHRVVLSIMKATFVRLLNELQRLGCHIVYATFHRITVATNKTSLAEAEEYINFVISTVRNQGGEDGEEISALARATLRPKQFHTHYLFLDEYNFGTMQLERLERSEADEDYIIEEEEGEDNDNSDSKSVVVASVVTAWSIMNYLGSEHAQEYFRLIVGRYSKEVLKKQMELKRRELDKDMPSIFLKEVTEELLRYKKVMVSKHFSSALTRAVGEICKEDKDDMIAPPLMVSSRSGQIDPALEFIKSVLEVLKLDGDVDEELHILKRSLLAQVGVPEYSDLAKWVNPCPTFILPGVFCAECHESRDINLCYIPPPDEEEEGQPVSKNKINLSLLLSVMVMVMVDVTDEVGLAPACTVTTSTPPKTFTSHHSPRFFFFFSIIRRSLLLLLLLLLFFFQNSILNCM